MLTALVLKHVDIEGPGLSEYLLRQEGVRYSIIDSTTQHIPEADILVPMGGPMSVNDDYPWLKVELAAIRKHVEGGGYLFGTCLGAQLLAKAIGGTVEPAGIREVGSYEVELTPTGIKDPLFRGTGKMLKVLHWHGDTFRSLPEQAVALATGNGLQQAFKYKNAVGLQFHWEATEGMVKQWIDADEGYLAGVPTTREEVLRGFKENSEVYRGNLNTVFGRFLEMAEAKRAI